MPTPIIEIPVDASDFEKFKALFDKYRQQVKEIPGGWNAIDKAIGSAADSAAELTEEILEQAGAASTLAGAEKQVGKEAEAAGSKFIKITAALNQQSELARKLAKEEEKGRKEAEKTGHAWAGMAKTTKTVAGNILSATTSLLKWTGIIGGLGGLLGAGGLFGIDRMAASAGASRKSALGIGSSIGEQKAFEINYGKYVGDPDTFLSNINQIAHDQSQQWGLGGTVAQLSRQGKSTAEIGAELMPQLVQEFESRGSTEQGYKSAGLERFGSMEDFLRMSQMKSEMAGSQSAYRRDVGTTGFSDQTARSWQNFTMQMDRAGAQIEATFVKRLVVLEPKLEQLSASFTKFIDDLLNEKRVGPWLDSLAKGLGDLAGYLQTDDFKSKIAEFVNDVGALASATERALKLFGFLPEDAPDPKTASNRDILQWNTRHPDREIEYHDTKDDPDPRKSDWFARTMRFLGVPLGGVEGEDPNVPVAKKSSFLTGSKVPMDVSNPNTSTDPLRPANYSLSDDRPQRKDSPFLAMPRDGDAPTNSNTGAPGGQNSPFLTESRNSASDPNTSAPERKDSPFLAMPRDGDAPTNSNTGAPGGQNSPFLTESRNSASDPNTSAPERKDSPFLAASRSSLLDAIKDEESRGNPDAVSPKGALGPYQFMPETAKQYDLADPTDPIDSRKASDHYLADLAKQFGGDIEKALAAYNWGPGNVQKDIDKFGGSWKEHLPDETRDYLRDIANALKPARTSAAPAAAGPRDVRIINQTGGSTIAISSQIAS